MRHSLLSTALSCSFALIMPAFAQIPATISSPQAPSVDKPAAAAANTPPAPPAPAAPTAIPAPPPPTPEPASTPSSSPTTSAPAAVAPEAPVKRPMHKPMKGNEPMSGGASHILAGDTKGEIAPRLPSPKLGLNASPDDYLMAAKTALKSKRTGEAQEALEMAETRMLDRSTPVDQAGNPASDPQILAVHDALDGLGKKDFKGAEIAIDHAMSGKVEEPSTAKPMHHKMMHKKPADAAPPPQ